MKNSKVPKIIWQTYEVDYDDLRYDYKMASLTWKNLNPGWEYRYRNAKEKELDVMEYSEELYEYYQYLDLINKADVWRLCILYKYGGLYTDMDSVCQHPLDDIIENWIKSDNFILAPRMSTGVSVTGTIASIKNSQTIKNILDDLLIEIKNTAKIGNYIEHIGFDAVSNIMKKYYDDADFNLLSCLHGGHEGGKYAYSSDFSVYYNGENVLYCDLAKRNNWIF
jgi:hypothetical protein